MARTQFFGEQILDLAITNAKLAGSIELSKLTKGADIILKDGSVAFTANQSLGSNKITNLANGVDANDAVNKSQLDSAVSGISWVAPALTLGLVGNLAVAAVNALTPASGEAYVMTDAGTLTSGSLSVAAGDMVEFDGTDWQLLAAGAGGFPADGARAILSADVALVSPYTDGSDESKIVEFDGTSLTGADTSQATEGTALLINDADNIGINDSIGYVYDASEGWIQFTGAGQINAGAGLTKSGNTLNIGSGNGIDVSADAIAAKVDSVISNPFLQVGANGLSMAGVADGSMIIGDASGRPAVVAMSGDATLANDGTLTLSSDVTKEADFVFYETPTGLINGSNTSFTTANTSRSGTLRLYLAGQELREGSGDDFTVSGTAITMTFAPATGQKLWCHYMK